MMTHHLVMRLFSIAVYGLLFIVAAFLAIQYANAANIYQFKDTLSDSGPGEQSNHTLEFTLNTDVSPGGYIDITPPTGFSVINSASSTFEVRNVEMIVDGVTRTAGAVAAPGVDQVDITPGSPGLIRYTLAPNSGLDQGDRVKIKIGNHTSGAVDFSESFSTTTGTTTVYADEEPIVNSSATGTHKVDVKIYDGGLVASAGFVIAIIDKVTIPNVDTTEEIPPYRFNPAPTSTVGGTTLSVEISLETDEFAFCRWSSVAGTPFTSMTNVFDNTGLIVHSTVVSVSPGSLQTFYIRCIDDENNFNIDDFLIQFVVNERPTGESNTEGSDSGDGTGTGNSGGGSGSGSGGTSGEANGQEPLEGGSSGSGGAGGGGGGGSGGGSGSTAGGGFESADAPYRSGDGRVIISGYAFPNSTITILVDGNIADTTRSSGSGLYEIVLDQIARGVYTFGVYGTDPGGVKSSTFSTSFTVTGARTSELSNINVMPSVKASPDPVQIGQTLTLSGYAIPNSTVTIENARKNSSQKKTFTATADSAGRWSTPVDTNSFSQDTYQVRAKSEITGGATTNFSQYTYYGVGQNADTPLNADLNTDGRVNLTDFSILLFWWNSDGGNSNPPADINRGGRVDLTDFSIMLFNWTG